MAMLHESERTLTLPNSIMGLIDRLVASNHEAYVVGGSLRDKLLGLEPHDYDLATSALPEQTLALFSDLRVIATGLKHGTVTVIAGGAPVEITTFRVDGGYTDARHPDSVTFTDRITEDLARRDFTVNAMAYHPDRGLVDPFGGKDDLARGILRAVGDPNKRFAEDALRIMRAFRFSAQLGFSIESETLRGCTESKYKLTSIAKERIASEFLRLLTSQNPSPALRAMIDTGILLYVTEDYAPGEQILARLSEMPREDIARLGFFFADTDRDHAAAIMRKLKYSNKQILGAGATLSCLHQSVRSDADARHLIASCGIYAPLAVRASVLLGYSPAEAIASVEQNRAPCTLSDLAIGGKELMAIGIRGKEIGETLNALLSAVLENPENNQKERLLSLARAIWNPKS